MLPRRHHLQMHCTYNAKECYNMGGPFYAPMSMSSGLVLYIAIQMHDANLTVVSFYWR